MYLVLGGTVGLQLVDLVQGKVYEARRGSWVTGETDGQIAPHVACRPAQVHPLKPWGREVLDTPTKCRARMNLGGPFDCHIPNPLAANEHASQQNQAWKQTSLIAGEADGDVIPHVARRPRTHSKTRRHMTLPHAHRPLATGNRV